MELLQAYSTSSTRKSDVMSESYARLTRIYCTQFINQLSNPIPTGGALLQSIVLFLSRNNRKASSNRVVATALCSFLEYCALLQPTDTERIVSRYPQPPADWSTSALSRDQQRIMLDSLRLRGKQFSRVRDYTMTCTMLLSGIRVSQCTSITEWELTESSLIITVLRQKNKLIQPRKKELPLVAILPDGVSYKNIIHLYMNLRPRSSAYLFPARDGTKISESYVRKFLDNYVPFDMHPHSLRHTAGSIIANNVSVPSASALLDHASIMTTMRYIAQPESTADIIRSAWAVEQEGNSLL